MGEQVGGAAAACETPPPLRRLGRRSTGGGRVWASRRCGRARAGPLEVVAPAAADEGTREYSEAAHQMRGHKMRAMAKEKGAVERDGGLRR